MKVAFVALVLLNILTLFSSVGRFFVTFAEVEHPHAYFEGMEHMREFLFPSLQWLVGIALVNLAFAGVTVFIRRRAAA